MSTVTAPQAADANPAPQAEIAALVERARAAQRAIAHYTQEQVELAGSGRRLERREAPRGAGARRRRRRRNSAITSRKS